MDDRLRSNAPFTLMTAALMLYFGWVAPARGVSASAFYNTTVDILYGTLRFGGLAMLAVAAGYFAGWKPTRWLNAAVSGACGLVLLLVGAYWLIDAGLASLQSLLLVVFGVMFLRDAASAWRSHVAERAAGDAAPDARDAPPVARPARPGPPQPAHPATLRPSTLADAENQPPPEGYLAALSKEDEKPPTASYE
jgi:hypothetical protein